MANILISLLQNRPNKSFRPYLWLASSCTSPNNTWRSTIFTKQKAQLSRRQNSVNNLYLQLSWDKRANFPVDKPQWSSTLNYLRIVKQKDLSNYKISLHMNNFWRWNGNMEINVKGCSRSLNIFESEMKLKIWVKLETCMCP